MEDELVVSVLCTTYNHKTYIQNTLNSFIAQKTNFKFEVVVHDDASTDGTIDIILEYEKKYPEIIKSYIQKENQYSKGIKVATDIGFHLMKGKYTAFCEGDDYWSDEFKLQRQVDALNNNQDCALCTHYTQVFDLNKNKNANLIPSVKRNLVTGVLDRDLQMKVAVDDLFHLTSCMFKTSILKDYINNQPLYAKMMVVGDVPLLIYFAEKSRIYFISKTMSVYNSGVEGSWTSRIAKNKEKNLKRIEKQIEASIVCKEFVSPKNLYIIQKKIDILLFNYNLEKENFKYLINKKNISIFMKYKISTKIKIILGAYIPLLYKLVKKLRKIK